MSERKARPHNHNTRALISALRSDHVSLRRAAAEILDKAVEGEKRPMVALMVAFDTSDNTARALVLERARVTKSGARKAVE